MHFLFSSTLTLLSLLLVIIVGTWGKSFMSSERETSAECPSALQKVFSMAAWDVPENGLMETSNPAGWTCVLYNTIANSDRMLQGCHRAPQRDNTTRAWMFYICIIRYL